MKKGFTLIELVVVLIIVAVLGVLGLTQYTGLIEKARGAEAKEILGSLRKLAAAYYMEKGTVLGLVESDIGIGTTSGTTPSSCSPSHYFRYNIFSAPTATTVLLRATRCTSATPGKEPQGPSGNYVNLDSNLSAGTDTWSSVGNY